MSEEKSDAAAATAAVSAKADAQIAELRQSLESATSLITDLTGRISRLETVIGAVATLSVERSGGLEGRISKAVHHASTQKPNPEGNPETYLLQLLGLV